MSYYKIQPAKPLLSYTANIMPADALATLGSSASAGMVLTPKPEYFVSCTRRVLGFPWTVPGQNPSFSQVPGGPGTWENLGWYWNMPQPGISRDFPGLRKNLGQPGISQDYLGLKKSQVVPGNPRCLGKPGMVLEHAMTRDIPGFPWTGATWDWDLGFPGTTWDMGLAKSQVVPGYLGKPGTLNQRPGITWDFWTWIAPIIKSDIVNHIIHFNILY